MPVSLRFRSMFLAMSVTLGVSMPGCGAAAPETVDAGSIAAFVEREIGDLLRRSWVPGAAIAVVQDDRTLLVQGYGLANVETGQEVDGRHTLFRIGSITKVMTTAAALRLVEQGRLQLDSDVNRYLRSLELPPTFLEPVTARALMTHRGGFDTDISGLMMPRDADTILSPEARQNAFVRARPVTAPFVYDNLGFGLLGTVVADISGVTYRDALHKLVFAPLGMETAVVGLPDPREPDAARCHRPDEYGRPGVCRHMLIADVTQGGGDVSASAADMALFMRALLTPGKLLQASTLQQMKDTDTGRLHPLLPGLGLALREADYAGRRSIGHHGSITGFISEFALFPAQGLGVFISVNGEGTPAGPRAAGTLHGEGVATGAIDARPLVEEFVTRFAAAFVPETTLPMEAAASLAEEEVDAAGLAGDYWRSDESVATAPGPMTAAAIEVRLIGEGELDAFGCAPFIRRAPMYYECRPAVGYPIKLAFRRDVQGRILLGHIAIEALERHSPSHIATSGLPTEN